MLSNKYKSIAKALNNVKPTMDLKTTIQIDYHEGIWDGWIRARNAVGAAFAKNDPDFIFDEFIAETNK